MVFCFLSNCCVCSSLEAVLVLGRMALEERAMLAAPSPSDVLGDYLRFCMLLQGVGW